VPDSEWRPVQFAADAITRQRFRRESAEVEVVVATYERLAQGKELGGFANRPGGDAEVLATARRAAGNRVLSEQRIATAGGESLLWIEYRVDSRSFAAAAPAQLWYGWRTLSTLRSVPSSVRLWRSPCAPDCNAARAGLQLFLDAMGESA
jgi:hypothetical protein